MIARKIKQIVESLQSPYPNKFTFYHTEQYEMNEQSDPSTPFVHLMHPIKGFDELDQFGVSGTRYPLNIFFLTDSRLTEKYSEREQDVEYMIQAKNRFVKKLFELIETPEDTTEAKGERITAILSSNYEEMFNEYSSNMDGILLKLEIRTVDNSC